MHRRRLLKTVAALPAWSRLLYAQGPGKTWLGPDYWANPIQDWRRDQSRILCHVAGGDRNVFWLTRHFDAAKGYSASVSLGALNDPTGPGWAGFRLGMRGYFNDYRDTALKGLGFEAGILADGTLFAGAQTGPKVANLRDIRLHIEVRGQRLTLRAGDRTLERDIAPDQLTGGMALVCHSGKFTPADPRFPREPIQANTGKPSQARGGDVRFWFSDWTAEGPGVSTHPDRAWGPILFNQYTLSRRILKMSVQLVPAEGGEPEVELHAKGRLLAKAPIEPLSSTAVFRIERWDDSHDTPYEVRFNGHKLQGVIRADPKQKPNLTVAALTCQGEFGFPHTDIAKSLTDRKPDLLLFTGDQLYEANGGYGIQRGPLAAARLDYLRKWYMFGWAWGHLTRDIPCVCLPDDHDVYHGNVWGAGGRKAEYPAGVDPLEPGINQQDGQDSGGFVMPATWVNMVQRTQVSHLPDPIDPAPVDQNISVYFTHLVWGGVSFALLEDRKFKSAPKTLMPAARIRNGWPQNPNWDAAKTGDVPGAQLLGPRQEAFLERWAQDWDGGIRMKAVVSQTIFCNLATLPKDAMSDAVTNSLPIQPLDGYAPGEKLTMDHDSNAWPQTPRNRALRAMRSCLALHIAGDQHLGSTVQYGIDAHNDAAFAICTPSISNIFPRRWFPPIDGANRPAGAARNLGEFRDGFGNRITVHAVANPQKFGLSYPAVNDRAPGYGIIAFDKTSGRIELTNLRRFDGQPYPGWPIAIDIWRNGLAATPHAITLPRAVSGLVQVIPDTPVAKPTYTVYAAQTTNRLPVWEPGRYRVLLNRRSLGIFTATS